MESRQRHLLRSLALSALLAMLVGRPLTAQRWVSTTWSERQLLITARIVSNDHELIVRWAFESFPGGPSRRFNREERARIADLDLPEASIRDDAGTRTVRLRLGCGGSTACVARRDDPDSSGGESRLLQLRRLDLKLHDRESAEELLAELRRARSRIVGHRGPR